MKGPVALKVWEDDLSSLPKKYRRTVLEFTVTDERNKRLNTADCIFHGLPITDCICRGKFHSIRVLTSYWNDKERQVFSSVRYVKESVTASDKVEFDARECPDIEGNYKYPYAVLKYMSEGSLHHSCTELLAHCTLALRFFSVTEDEKKFILESLKKVPDSYRLYKEEGYDDFVINSTMRGWKRFIDDNEGNSSPLYKCLYKEFYTVFPKTCTPSLDTVVDNT